MPRISLDIESLTPLFLGGADPSGEPELRPASFRGALRFWFRTLYGGVIGIGDLNLLRKEEAETFGTTENGSPVIVRLRGNASSQPFSSYDSGVQYLFWSVIGPKRNQGRNCFPPNSQFTLTLQTRAGVDGDEPLKRALAALWLLTRLGGIGSRARRGAGSLQITQLNHAESAGLMQCLGLPDFKVRATTPDQLRGELATGLRRLRSLIGAQTVDSLVNPDFDVLHPDCCRVIVMRESWRTWSEALNDIGTRYKEFRIPHPPDLNIRNALLGRGKNFQPVPRAAFGLPIVFHYRDRRVPDGSLEGEDHDRRASPLMIRVARLANGKFAVVLTVFKATLLDETYLDPEDYEQLKLKPKGSAPVYTAPPDLSIIDRFLDGLHGQEVNFRE